MHTRTEGKESLRKLKWDDGSSPRLEVFEGVLGFRPKCCGDGTCLAACAADRSRWRTWNWTAILDSHGVDITRSRARVRLGVQGQELKVAVNCIRHPRPQIWYNVSILPYVGSPLVTEGLSLGEIYLSLFFYFLLSYTKNISLLRPRPFPPKHFFDYLNYWYWKHDWILRD